MERSRDAPHDIARFGLKGVCGGRNRPNPRPTSVKFEQNATYTRKQIAEALGGIGPGVMPAKNGKALAGLFDPSENAMTHLTGEIDVFPKKLPKGLQPGGDKIPVFLKISSQLWRYVGEYTLADIQTGKKAKQSVGRDDVVGVLRFVPVKPPLKLVRGK